MHDLQLKLVKNLYVIKANANTHGITCSQMQAPRFEVLPGPMTAFLGGFLNQTFNSGAVFCAKISRFARPLARDF